MPVYLVTVERTRLETATATYKVLAGSRAEALSDAHRRAEVSPWERKREKWGPVEVRTVDVLSAEEAVS